MAAMVDNEIFQDSAQMEEIANSIKGDSKELANIVEELYSLLDDELGEEDNGNKAWFGTKAMVFLQNIKAKYNDFINATKNVDGIGQALQEIAEAWSNFEKGD